MQGWLNTADSDCALPGVVDCSLSPGQRHISSCMFAPWSGQSACRNQPVYLALTH